MYRNKKYSKFIMYHNKNVFYCQSNRSTRYGAKIYKFIAYNYAEWMPFKPHKKFKFRSITGKILPKLYNNYVLS